MQSSIGHVNKQSSHKKLWTGIPRIIQSKYSVVFFITSLIACAWEFQNDALWDTPLHAQFVKLQLY